MIASLCMPCKVLDKTTEVPEQSRSVGLMVLLSWISCVSCVSWILYPVSTGGEEQVGIGLLKVWSGPVEVVG